MKIMIAEPLPGLANFISKGLTAEGHAVEIRRTRESALQLLGAFHFDLLILELNLPDGGLMLLQQLRAEGGRVHVIILTEHPLTPMTAIRLQPLDVAAYITKPFSYSKLAIQVNELAAREAILPA